MTTIYAIIKDSSSSRLYKISEHVSTSRHIADKELCEGFNYAYDLSAAYCSYLPKIDKIINCKNVIYKRDVRMEVVSFYDTIKRLKDKYGDRLIAYSHRFGGWTSFEWKFNEDIQFQVATNFGFGSNSYFRIIVVYKRQRLAPYSDLVKYRYANFSSISSYTYKYDLEYSKWDNLMDDALNFYNAIVENQDDQIFKWISTHLEKMTSELERYIYSSYCYYDNYGTSERVEGDDFWIAKSFKISEALRFIDNIKSLPIQVDPSKYIDKIYRINRCFLPKLIEKINSLKFTVLQLEKQITVLTNEMPLSLYVKLREKYYYSKRWDLYSNKFSMIIFLMRVLRRKSNISVAQIRSNLIILKRQINELEELNRQFSRESSTLTKLSDYCTNITTTLNSVKESTSDDES